MKNKIYRLTFGGQLIALPDDLAGSYNSVNTMLEEIKVPAIILLDGLKPEDDNSLAETFAALYQLRHSAIFYAAPVYFARSMGNLDAFADGIGSTKKAILPYASEILAKMRTLPIETNAANNDLRLLTFLFCRGDACSLSPLAIASSPGIYEYPAALLIGGFADSTRHTAFRFDTFLEKNFSEVSEAMLRSSAEWLEALCAQGFLAAIKLVDRIRICPNCNTGNLNYIDSCPTCGSIDFAKKRMLHCFTCSHVAPEETFKSGMMLVCRRCNSTLRHIGSDYDRPVESYVCNSCNERFIEPEVKADCFKCRKKSATGDLTIRQLYNYGLTIKGKRFVQLGIAELEFSVFDSHRNVLPVYFYQTVDWLLQMKRRYSDEDFSLLCIKITGLEEIESTIGITQIKKLIDELAVRIRELIRTTDISTSTGANIFWVLLPRTPQKGGEILGTKIEKLADMISLEDITHISIKTKSFSIPAEYANSEYNAEMLISGYETTF